MSDTSAFRRMREFEFRSFLDLRIVRAGSAQGQGGLERAASWIGLAFGIIYLWGGCAVFRGRELDWSWQHPVLAALAWLLWGLGGMLPMLVAVWAAGGLSGGPQGQPTKPLAWLLPLSPAQRRRAAFQGRGAVLAITVGVSWALLLIVRLAILLLDLARVTPSLFDPWLLAAPMLFVALFIISAEAADRARAGTGAVSCCGLALALGGLVAFWTGSQASPALSQWCVPLGAGVFLVWVWLTVVVSRAVAAHTASRQREAHAPAPRDLPRRETHVPPRPSAGFLRLLREAFYPTAFQRPGRGVVAILGQQMMGAAVVAVFMLGLGLVCHLCVIASAAVSYLGEHGQLPPGPPPLGRDALEFTGIMPLLVLGGLIGIGLPFFAWPEGPVVAGTPGTMSGVMPYQMPGRHFGFLLPIPARTLWLQRLAWLVTTALWITLAFLASRAVLLWVGELLGADVRRAVTFDPGLALLGTLWPCLTLFAGVPIFRMVSKALSVSGCAIWPLVGVGFVAWILSTFLGLEFDSGATDGRHFVVPILLSLWPVLLLVLSYLWCEPRAWPRSPDGSCSDRSASHATAAAVAVPVTVFLAICLLVALLDAT